MGDRIQTFPVSNLVNGGWTYTASGYKHIFNKTIRSQGPSHFSEALKRQMEFAQLPLGWTGYLCAVFNYLINSIFSTAHIFTPSLTS